MTRARRSTRIALRAPGTCWSADGFDRFDPRPLGPAIQKYDTRRLRRASWSRDPRDVAASSTRRRRVVVPGPGRRSRPTAGGPAERLQPVHAGVARPMRKLYQPSHERFYAVTSSCSATRRACRARARSTRSRSSSSSAGCSRAFTQRTRPSSTLTQVPRPRPWPSACPRRCELADPSAPAEDEYPPNDPTRDTAEDLAALPLPRAGSRQGGRLRGRQRANCSQRIGIEHELQGWFVQADGSGSWQAVAYRPTTRP